MPLAELSVCQVLFAGPLRGNERTESPAEFKKVPVKEPVKDFGVIEPEIP
jgi:hypothetical protein